jgi:hypothetical protein
VTRAPSATSLSSTALRLRRLVVAASPAALLGLFCVALLASKVARAEDLESDAVYVPASGARSLAVRNPLGAVRVQGWDRPEVRIVANKHAGSPSVLSRLRVRVDFGEGGVRVTTGYYLSDNTFNPLPLAGAGIDLAIDAPRQVALEVATFRGEVDASGFRSGARLSSQQGHIRVADLEGQVDTRALDGNQWLEAIRGSLAATGVVGDLDLAGVRGERVDAAVFRGKITARDLDAQVVRLHSTVGTVLLIGALRPGARYDLATRDGDVRLMLHEAPFDVVARSGNVRSRVPLEAAGGEPRVWRHVVLARPVEETAPPAMLDLASAHGLIEIAPAP